MASGQQQQQSLVLVFDYDWSLINANSDTYLFEQLDSNTHEHLRHISSSPDRRGDWTSCVDEALVRLQTSAGEASPAVDVAQIKHCLARVPVLDGMLDALRLVAASAFCSVMVISDANDVFIDAFLAHHGLRDAVAKVESNVAFLDESGRLRVRAHVDPSAPHTCGLCPKNLCKGAVLDRLGLLASAKRIVYVGDGGGDLCPGLRLRTEDILLVRDDEAYPSARGLVRGIAKHRAAHPMRATIKHWQTGQDVLATVVAALAEHAPAAATAADFSDAR